MRSSSDIRYALRALARSPGFTVTSVTTLALGIGANVTIFSLANSMLIRPLPGLPHPEGLVTVRFYEEGGAYFPISHPNYSDLRDEARPYLQLAAYQPVPIHLVPQEGGRPERLDGEIVSANYFRLMGLSAARGRLLTPDDAAPGATPVAVISHRLWRRAYGADEKIVGSEITINGIRFVVSGVAPERYLGAGLSSNTDVWVPISAHALTLPYHEGDVTTDRGDAIWFQLLGRLRTGTSMAVAERRLAAATASLVEAYPKQNRMLSFTTPRLTAGAGANPFQRARIEKTLSIMLGVVFFVLLLACANALNLVLARATGRQREMAIRRALGAGRFRLLRLFLSEGLIVGLGAGGAGLFLAAWLAGAFEGTRVIRWLPGIRAPELDWLVLAFTVASSLAVGLVLGFVPRR
jgi:predicted permease